MNELDQEVVSAYVLSQTVSKCANSIENILVQARKLLSESKGDFIDDYSVLGKAISEYSSLFNRTKCQSRNELESLWSDNFSNLDVREAVEDLLRAEEKWNQFLMDVDKSVLHFKNTSEQEEKRYPLSLKSNVNEILRPLFLTQVDAADGSEKIEQLGDILSHNTEGYEENKKLFASLSCRIYIVSFNISQVAMKWKLETGCLFPIFTDTARQFYNLIGFKRSFFQVWKIKTMIFYGEQINKGTFVPGPVADYKDDPLQMGGNAIFDSKGSLVFLHSSKEPADRPSVDAMLSVLRSLKTKKEEDFSNSLLP